MFYLFDFIAQLASRAQYFDFISALFPIIAFPSGDDPDILPSEGRIPIANQRIFQFFGVSQIG